MKGCRSTSNCLTVNKRLLQVVVDPMTKANSFHTSSFRRRRFTGTFLLQFNSYTAVKLLLYAYTATLLQFNSYTAAALLLYAYTATLLQFNSYTAAALQLLLLRQ